MFETIVQPKLDLIKWKIKAPLCDNFHQKADPRPVKLKRNLLQESKKILCVFFGSRDRGPQLVRNKPTKKVL